jgi:hypothetical protein
MASTFVQPSPSKDNWIERLPPLREPSSEEIIVFRMPLDVQADHEKVPEIDEILVKKAPPSDAPDGMLFMARSGARTQPVPVLSVAAMFMANEAMVKALELARPFCLAPTSQTRLDMEKNSPSVTFSHICGPDCHGFCAFGSFPSKGCRSFAFEGFCAARSCPFAHYAPVVLDGDTTKLYFVAVRIRKACNFIKAVAPLFVFFPALREDMSASATAQEAQQANRAQGRERRRRLEDKAQQRDTEFSTRELALAEAHGRATDALALSRQASVTEQQRNEAHADQLRNMRNFLKQHRAQEQYRSLSQTAVTRRETPNPSPAPTRPEGQPNDQAHAVADATTK